MAAKVTFCNLNGKTQPSPFVSLHTERVRTEPEAVVMSTTSTSGTEGVKRRHTSSSEDHHESSVDAPPTSAAAEGVELNQRYVSYMYMYIMWFLPLIIIIVYDAYVA